METAVRTHCKHGHDLTVVGVNYQGSCRECKRAQNKAWRARNVRSSPSFPSQPLADLLRQRMKAMDWSARDLAVMIASRLPGESPKVIERHIWRILNHHVRLFLPTVDSFCIALGTHPSLVYGTEMWEHTA